MRIEVTVNIFAWEKPPAAVLLVPVILTVSMAVKAVRMQFAVARIQGRIRSSIFAWKKSSMKREDASDSAKTKSRDVNSLGDFRLERKGGEAKRIRAEGELFRQDFAEIYQEKIFSKATLSSSFLSWFFLSWAKLVWAEQSLSELNWAGLRSIFLNQNFFPFFFAERWKIVDFREKFSLFLFRREAKISRFLWPNEKKFSLRCDFAEQFWAEFTSLTKSVLKAATEYENKK